MARSKVAWAEKRYDYISPIRKWGKWVVLGLFIAPILSNPMFNYTGRDSGFFLYVGSLVLKGKIPYMEVWENKGPLVFYADGNLI